MNKAVPIFRSIPVTGEKHELTKMRGNPEAKFLLIAPPFSEAECRKGVPFSDHAATLFHEILAQEAHLDTNQDFMVVSCNRYGLKANKHSTQPIVDFVLECGRKSLFDFYLCIGDDAFKFVFGHGKKPSMSALAGHVMYVAETDFKPLYVFPDHRWISHESFDNSLEDWQIDRIINESTRKITNYARSLRRQVNLCK